MRSKHRAFVIAMLYMAARSAPELTWAAPPAIYDFTPAGLRSFGAAVNDTGQVAGTCGTIAFRYDLAPGGGGVMHFLTLGFNESSGYGINNAGQVAVEGFLSTGGVYFAFRYDGTPGIDGVGHDLGSLNAFGEGASAYGINDAGQVTGWSNITGSTFPPVSHAFRYDDAPGVMHDLGTLGGSNSFGRGINNAGQVAGTSEITGSSTQHAFLYTSTPGAGGVMHDLGTLGGTNSYVNGINDAGQIAGRSQTTGNTAHHAFLYSGTPGAGGAMHDLGTLGGTDSAASAVNDAGQVVGNSQITGDTAWHAFLYTGTPGAGGQMIDLDAWLDANIPTEGAKWTLSGEGVGASDISNTGWITGTGIYDPDGPGGVPNEFRAYLLDASSLIVPEPAAGALALLGVSNILLLRRRSLGRPNKFHCAPNGFRARKQTTRSAVCTFLMILLCTSAAARAFAAASLTPLGDLPGGGFRSVANAVSDDGSTVVGFSGLGGGQEAFRWTSGSGMVGLGDLSGGDFESSADAVSSDGAVVVGYGTRGTSIESREAFRWTSDSGMVGLGNLPGSSSNGWAHGDSGHDSFRWTSGCGMVGLGSFGLAGIGVSADGSVIVGVGGR